LVSGPQGPSFAAQPEEIQLAGQSDEFARFDVGYLRPGIAFGGDRLEQLVQSEVNLPPQSAGD
jgi:hypothetical protein